MALLELKNMSLFFGGVKANQNISFSLEPGKLYGLIGPNGAGKSTIFNVITGIYRPTQGDVFFQGDSLVGLSPFEIAKKGIGRTFQNIRLFKQLTVEENVMTAFFSKSQVSFLSEVLCLPEAIAEKNEFRKQANELLQIMGLEEFSKELAGNLPYGMQRKLEMARALGLSPKLLILDEPAAGLNPAETQELTKLIQVLQQSRNITVLLIEHDMRLVMQICESIFVLDHGELIAAGEPSKIQNDPKVITAYLGVDE
jgi:branched-chain amino acid transport system ATP-binding protein